MADRGAAAVLSRAELRALAPLAGATAVRMFGLFLLLPVIAPHVAAHPDGTVALAGLAVGAYGLAQAIMLAPLGWLSDRWGRKPVLLGALALFAAGGFLGGSFDHPLVIIVGRLLQGFGAVSAVVLAAVVDATSARTRAQGMAVIGIAISVSFGLALALSGPLLLWLGVPGMLTLSGALGLVAFAVVAAASFPRRVVHAGLAANAIDVRLLPLCGGVLALHAAMAAMFVVVPLRLVELVGTARLWQVYLLALVIAGVCAGPFVVRRSLDMRLVWAAVAMVGLATGGLVAVGAAGVLAVGALLTVFFTGFIYLEAVLPVRASLLVTTASRGATMGLYAICQALGVFVGGWSAGMVAGL